MPGSRRGQLWIVAALFVVLVNVYLASYVEWPVRPARPELVSRTNGTHAWDSTVLLISLDGLKPDYLDSGYMPNLLNLSQGRWPVGLHHSHRVLHAKSMIPVSPSLTFPNHWSILTGLLPSSHGIIANDFHTVSKVSPSRQFYYTDPSRSWDANWWKGVPVWEQLEKFGIKTANLMWPGPPITSDNMSNTYFQEYVKGWTLNDRLKRIVSWLDMKDDDRPRFICAYAPDVDSKTHSLGPNISSIDVIETLRQVDDFITGILNAIETRNASKIVNIVVVSDHGMTTTSNERLIYLEDLLGDSLYSQMQSWDGWPNVGLRFANAALLGQASERLRIASKYGKGRYTIADREELLDTWKWETTAVVKERVAELWILPEVGWSVTTRSEMERSQQDYRPKGNHGYHAHNAEMGAFFLALGPSIRTSIEGKLASFANLEIHNLVMDMLGIPYKHRTPNNVSSSADVQLEAILLSMGILGYIALLGSLHYEVTSRETHRLWSEKGR